MSRSGLPPSLESLVVTTEEKLTVTLARAAAAESHTKKGAALSTREQSVHADRLAAAARRVRLDCNEVELRSSPAGSVAGAAAGLALEICAKDVLFELPPGALADGPAVSGDSTTQLTSIAGYLAAWITASCARSVLLEPRRPAPGFAPQALWHSMGLSFKVGKRRGMHIRHVFTDADEMLRCLEPVCAAHRLTCSAGPETDGTIGGVLIGPTSWNCCVREL